MEKSCWSTADRTLLEEICLFDSDNDLSSFARSRSIVCLLQSIKELG